MGPVVPNAKGDQGPRQSPSACQPRVRCCLSAADSTVFPRPLRQPGLGSGTPVWGLISYALPFTCGHQAKQQDKARVWAMPPPGPAQWGVWGGRRDSLTAELGLTRKNNKAGPVALVSETRNTEGANTQIVTALSAARGQEPPLTPREPPPALQPQRRAANQVQVHSPI